MKRVLCVFLSCLLLITVSGCAENTPEYASKRSNDNVWKDDADNKQEEYLVEPNGTLGTGGYVEFERLKILYDGEYFSITSSREDSVVISVSVIGIKADGTYEFLQSPSFSGLDAEQYDKDMEENGWSIEHLTNQVQPNGTLLAKMDIFELEEYPNPDIDGDGYYDIIFNIIPVKEDGSVSTGDLIESNVYRLKK